MRPPTPGRRLGRYLFLAAVLLVLAAGAAALLLREPVPRDGPAAILAETVARAAALPRLRTLIVARDGVPLVERAFRDQGLDEPGNIKSVSKSVVSALVGIAIERGLLEGVDQPIAPILGEHFPSEADPRIEAITVRFDLAPVATRADGTPAGKPLAALHRHRP